MKEKTLQLIVDALEARITELEDENKKLLGIYQDESTDSGHYRTAMYDIYCNLSAEGLSDEGDVGDVERAKAAVRSAITLIEELRKEKAAAHHELAMWGVPPGDNFAENPKAKPYNLAERIHLMHEAAQNELCRLQSVADENQRCYEVLRRQINDQKELLRNEPTTATETVKQECGEHTCDQCTYCAYSEYAGYDACFIHGILPAHAYGVLPDDNGASCGGFKQKSYPVETQRVSESDIPHDAGTIIARFVINDELTITISK